MTVDQKRYRVVVRVDGEHLAPLAIGVAQPDVYDVVVEGIEMLARRASESAANPEELREIEKAVTVAKVTAKFFVNMVPIPALEVLGRQLIVEHEVHPAISSRGAAAYYRMSVAAYDFGLLSAVDLCERLKLLSDVCELAHVRSATARALEAIAEIGDGVGEARAYGPRQDCVELSDPPLGNAPKALSFLVRGLGRSGDYRFIAGDPDPLPSVPHGHLKSNHSHKLDAYRGIIFSGSQASGQRLSRQDIIDLWNDESFRRFASRELRHFMSADPTFQRRMESRRIRSPLKLPRKIRPSARLRR